MREKIYNIIDANNKETKFSEIYDVFMVIVIALSLVPLMFKTTSTAFSIIDRVTVIIFIIDYILRWMTADFKFEKKEVLSFAKYPFTPMAIVDLLSILPSISVLNKGYKILRVLRLFKALRVFKFFRYSKNIQIIVTVLQKQKDSLMAVLGIALGYIFISAITIFTAEPESFDNFFEAIYWATISLTTIGYGDIYATSAVGQFFTMISSLLGIAVVALPAGIITAGYLDELQNSRK